MAKSIDEMAKIECCNDVGIAYFKYGANYVLKELENIIENRNFVAFPKATYEELSKKIKELKGL